MRCQTRANRQTRILTHTHTGIAAPVRVCALLYVISKTATHLDPSTVATISPNEHAHAQQKICGGGGEDSKDN